MRKTFLLLLLGLLCSMGNAWGEVIYSSNMTNPPTNSTVSGNGAYAATTSSSPWSNFDNVTYPNRWYTSGSTNATTITFNNAINLTSFSNKKLTIKWGHTSAGKPLRVFVNNSEKTTTSSGTLSATSSNTLYEAVIDLSETSITSIKFQGKSSSGLNVFWFSISGTPATPTLTGAWSDASGSIWNGDEVPTPAFEVNASNSAELDGSEYTVVYSLKSGSTAGMITIPMGGASFTLNNSTTGTATLVATLTSTNESNFTTPATNTFEYVYTVNDKVPTYTLNKADNEISLRSTPVHRAASTNETATVTMSAGFLEGTAGTVAFTSEVDGLSVYPSSFTISEGSVSETEFTITYTSASGASGTATLRFTDGNSNIKDLVIEYTSVVAHTWATISSATTWDWNKLTKQVSLTDETTPTKSTEFILGDMDGEILTQNIGYDPETFNADALKVIAEHVSKKGTNYYLQGNSIKFQTTVPGTVTVVFSNTGGSRPYRYVKVNDILSNTGSNAGTEKHITSNAIAVSAGEVTISGYIPDASDPTTRSGDNVGPSMLRIYSITFTPITQVSGTVGSTGWSTFSSQVSLDLSTLSDGFTAYYAESANASNVLLKSTDATVSAMEGLMIKGSGDFTIDVAGSGSAISGNLLKAGNGIPVTYNANDGYNYVLVANGANAEFQNIVDGTPAKVQGGKAYLALPSAPSGAPSLLRIVEEENNTTSVEAIEATDKATKFFENGNLYILRDGVVYDVTGRVVK